MPSDFAFRLSTYLTLALSCVCIGYSEWDLLPESGVLALVVLVLLAVSFRSGTRYELDLQSANRVGMMIGLLAAGWLAYQFVNKNSLIYTLPWPASLLPYLGPLLMVLMPAKLFRPKHVGDWWAMQGIALAGVGLASSMAEDGMFGVLLSLYAVAGVTSLTLFFYRRSAGVLPPIPHTVPGPMPTVVATHMVRSGRVTARAMGWLVLAVGIGLPLFFLTPRSQAPKWQYGTSREVGLSSDQLADLNGVGKLSESRTVAFIVHATFPDGRPKDDLPPDQRWRAYALSFYDGGRWTAADTTNGMVGWGRPLLLNTAALTRVTELDEGNYQPPDFGPDQYRLDYNIRDQIGPPVLSDPIYWQSGKPPPICSFHGGQARSWYQLSDGTFLSKPMGTVPGYPTHYRQITRTPSSADANLGPPYELRRREPFSIEEDTSRIPDPLIDPAGPLTTYRTIRLPKLQFWTRDLLERLANTDSSIRSALGRAQQLRNFRIAPEDYELIGQALSAHLARSGEYKYGLNLRRVDPTTDPVEDFLYRSKEGHCQRFAAGLALMLRSVGIPANYVLGFKGCEAEGEGVYTTRQDHAHAWVEMLVVRPAPPDFPSRNRPSTVCHWLSLDPTPDGRTEESGETLTGWLGAARETGVAFFLNFIVNYNSDRRNVAVATVRDWLIRGAWVLTGLLVVVAGVGLARQILRRHSARTTPTIWSTGYEWFDRMTKTLADSGYPVTIGITPREYAESTGVTLAERPETAVVAGVPAAITRAFYQARYGGRPPVGSEFARIAEDLNRLQAALRTATMIGPKSLS